MVLFLLDCAVWNGDVATSGLFQARCTTFALSKRACIRFCFGFAFSFAFQLSFPFDRPASRWIVCLIILLSPWRLGGLPASALWVEPILFPAVPIGIPFVPSLSPMTATHWHLLLGGNVVLGAFGPMSPAMSTKIGWFLVESSTWTNPWIALVWSHCTINFRCNSVQKSSVLGMMFGDCLLDTQQWSRSQRDLSNFVEEPLPSGWCPSAPVPALPGSRIQIAQNLEEGEMWLSILKTPGEMSTSTRSKTENQMPKQLKTATNNRKVQENHCHLNTVIGSRSARKITKRNCIAQIQCKQEVNLMTANAKQRRCNVLFRVLTDYPEPIFR